jgi:hypothetical protein
MCLEIFKDYFIPQELNFTLRFKLLEQPGYNHPRGVQIVGNLLMGVVDFNAP